MIVGSGNFLQLIFLNIRGVLMNLSQEILKALNEKPGQKARELARKLNVERSDVNSILFSKLRSKVYQDSQYRW